MSCTIRVAGELDAEPILAIYAPLVEGSPVTFECEVPSLDDMRRRISETLVWYPWLVCEEKDRFLGFAYAARHRVRAAYQWSVETSVYVAADSRRRGIGRGLYASLLRTLTLQGFNNSYGGITLPNPASVGLHEGCGFELVGVYRNVGFKLGAWHDVGWWHRRLAPTRAAPQSPLPIAAAQKEEEWNSCVRAGVGLIR